MSALDIMMVMNSFSFFYIIYIYLFKPLFQELPGLFIPLCLPWHGPHQGSSQLVRGLQRKLGME